VLGRAWVSYDHVHQSERALAATAEAVAISRSLDRGALASALINWAIMLERVGQPEQAQAARNEHRVLTGGDPTPTDTDRQIGVADGS
jgi:hypothetical protein